jgi:DNA polymerase III subunit delta'
VNSLILHPDSKKLFDSYVKNTPHALLILAPKGSGKRTVVEALAKAVAGEHSAGRVFKIEPEIDKSTISIDAIRRIKVATKLKSDKKRVVTIIDADMMTIEAQNSLLKILEEPPQNTIFLLSTTNKDRLLETVVSRTTCWSLTPPTTEQIDSAFNNSDPQKKARALAISSGRIGLTVAMLNDEEHPLLQAIDTAKEILQESKFDRLCRVEVLSKNKQDIQDILEALTLTCKAVLEQAANQADNDKIAIWHAKLKDCMNAQVYFAQNVQAKLLLSNLLIRL